MDRIGLIDVDGHNYPNLPLMKISAWHKAQGSEVEWYNPWQGILEPYAEVYMSKVFSFTADYDAPIYAESVHRGGSGYAISLENGKEVYHKEMDNDLPDDIEHMYPDYSLYPSMTSDTAYGFLTRGCPRGCGFCHVEAKEGRCSRKEATGYDRGKGKVMVYILVNYDTTIEQDMYRIQLCRELNFAPYPMIYDKEHCDPIYRKIQRWCNNYVFWNVPTFEDYKG